MIECLLDRGANVHAFDNNERTHIQHAITLNGFLDGANIEQTDQNNWTAMIWAADRGYVSVITVLLDRGTFAHAANSNRKMAIHYAAANGHVSHLLLDRGANVDAVDVEQRISLMQAELNGHAEVIVLLLNRGANIEAVDAHI